MHQPQIPSKSDRTPDPPPPDLSPTSPRETTLMFPTAPQTAAASGLASSHRVSVVLVMLAVCTGAILTALAILPYNREWIERLPAKSAQHTSCWCALSLYEYECSCDQTHQGSLQGSLQSTGRTTAALLWVAVGTLCFGLGGAAVLSGLRLGWCQWSATWKLTVLRVGVGAAAVAGGVLGVGWVVYLTNRGGVHQGASLGQIKLTDGEGEYGNSVVYVVGITGLLIPYGLLWIWLLRNEHQEDDIRAQIQMDELPTATRTTDTRTTDQLCEQDLQQLTEHALQLGVPPNSNQTGVPHRRQMFESFVDSPRESIPSAT